MTIRSRLSVVMMAGVLISTLTVAGGVLWLERIYLVRQALRQPALVIDPVMKVAEESVVADDPMVLLSHLNFVQRNQPELVAIRLRRAGVWEDVRRPDGLPPPPGGELLSLRRTVRVVVPYDAPAEIEVEMRFSRDALLREYRQVFKQSLRTALLIIALVWLFAVPLAFWSAQRFLSAISELESGIERMASGQPVRPVPVDKRDEMGALIAKFNRMSQKLADLDQMKKDFASSVTHELRSPLAAIQSFARMLKRNPNTDDLARSQIQRIERSAERLTRFVDQLLESARIERGMFEIKLEETDMAELVRDAALFFQPRARELEIELDVDLPEGTLPAQADPERITQIVTNLIGNALKFTQKGGRVTVYARAAQAGEQRAVEAGVIDTGVGIAPNDMDKLFRPFERIENPMKTTGTGLGLSIAKTIAEMHGGIISVESKLGEGSRFFFIIPAAQPSAAATTG
ncbi:MAG: HAMP domain-containing sensor histidine kinase [Elusimicrobiota bacterium]